MALPSQIESAARTPKPGISSGWSDHLVAMPTVERDKALLELDRARRAIERIATPEAAPEILDALGLAGEPEPAKECHRCHHTKAASEFYPVKRHRDGLDTYCKPCRGQLHKKYRQAKKAAERRETLAAAIGGRGYRKPRTTEQNGNQ